MSWVDHSETQSSVLTLWNLLSRVSVCLIQISIFTNNEPFTSSNMKITVKHQEALAPSSCVAVMIQQWELTDWWNNEQRRAGWTRVQAHAFFCFSNLDMPASSGSPSSLLLLSRCSWNARCSCTEPFQLVNKTNRFGNFFSFRGLWCLYRLCVIWAPFLFCRTFLYLLIHLCLPAALMLVTA